MESGMAVRLNRFQRHLERIYEVSVALNVDHFLITDRRMAQRLDPDPGARAAVEKLLVREQEDGLDIALYIDGAVIDVLRSNDPLRCLNDANLAEFWTALEGVSHFLYLVWNARHGRSISLFELELQAEVDKYVAAVFLLGLQHGQRVPAGLHERLFANPVFDGALGGDELRRYHRANYYAGIYCGELRDGYLRRRSSMIKELRRFYRLTHRRKIEHIHGLARAG